MTPSDEIQQGCAVVTGAGSGLGQALSVELARRGMQVAGFGRREDALAETAAQIGDAFLPIKADVSDFTALRNGFDQVRMHFGPVTILINNAAVYPRRDLLEESPEAFMQVMAINLGGMVAATQYALTDMTRAGVGRIVNVSSFADIAPIPASAAYSVSKGAGRIWSRAMLADLHDRFPDIVISTWMPGMLATDMGIPDGLAPEAAAKWGAALSLWHDRAINGATFEMDREVPEPRGLKRKIKDAILLRRAPVPRKIPG
ncbi:SDR family oxidoreductase [Shimia biformata]|uniref:SDR family oxidoreductase n=1 Tax=Shimia biformata TaxID=1294299 RepID=UPI001950F055|nr:SDR family NAD(P)-dependent oxidoreductase [Shimia biformata]